MGGTGKRGGETKILKSAGKLDHEGGGGGGGGGAGSPLRTMIWFRYSTQSMKKSLMENFIFCAVIRVK